MVTINVHSLQCEGQGLQIFFLLKGHKIMSYGDTILVGQIKVLVEHHQELKLCILYIEVDFVFFLTIKGFMLKKLSRHNIQTQVGFHRTLANFGWPMSDDQLLFAASEGLPDHPLHATLY